MAGKGWIGWMISTRWLDIKLSNILKALFPFITSRRQGGRSGRGGRDRQGMIVGARGLDTSLDFHTVLFPGISRLD